MSSSQSGSRPSTTNKTKDSSKVALQSKLKPFSKAILRSTLILQRKPVLQSKLILQSKPVLQSKLKPFSKAMLQSKPVLQSKQVLQSKLKPILHQSAGVYGPGGPRVAEKTPTGSTPATFPSHSPCFSLFLSTLLAVIVGFRKWSFQSSPPCFRKFWLFCLETFECSTQDTSLQKNIPPLS